MPAVIEGDYEWDAAKAEANAGKHGVTFHEAVVALEDPRALHFDDPADAANVLTLGASAGGVLVVVSTDRKTRTRIISARKANRNEIRRYQAEGP